MVDTQCLTSNPYCVTLHLCGSNKHAGESKFEREKFNGEANFVSNMGELTEYPSIRVLTFFLHNSILKKNYSYQQFIRHQKHLTRISILRIHQRTRQTTNECGRSEALNVTRTDTRDRRAHCYQHTSDKTGALLNEWPG